MMRLASRQHGVVNRAQLLQVGLSAGVIDRRVKAKRLRVLHRGVYQLGPLRTARTREMAAVLACGSDAAVSRRSSAVLWDLLRDRRAGLVEVNTPSGDHSRRPGIRAYRVASLAADEVTRLDGIPITTLERTLYDLARGPDRRDLERALAAALRLGRAQRDSLLCYLERYPGRRGTGRLRSLLERDEAPAFTRSDAEDRFLDLIRKAELPPPSVNVQVAGHELDFFWREEGLVVEVDGFAYHSSAREFENDRQRDEALTAAGCRVMRVTWDQLVSKPAVVLVRVAHALGPSTLA